MTHTVHISHSNPQFSVVKEANSLISQLKAASEDIKVENVAKSIIEKNNNEINPSCTSFFCLGKRGITYVFGGAVILSSTGLLSTLSEWFSPTPECPIPLLNLIIKTIEVVGGTAIGAYGLFSQSQQDKMDAPARISYKEMKEKMRLFDNFILELTELEEKLNLLDEETKQADWAPQNNQIQQTINDIVTNLITKLPTLPEVYGGYKVDKRDKWLSVILHLLRTKCPKHPLSVHSRELLQADIGSNELQTNTNPRSQSGGYVFNTEFPFLNDSFDVSEGEQGLSPRASIQPHPQQRDYKKRYGEHWTQMMQNHRELFTTKSLIIAGRKLKKPI